MPTRKFWLVALSLCLLWPFVAGAQAPMFTETLIRDATLTQQWAKLPDGPCILAFQRQGGPPGSFGVFSCGTPSGLPFNPPPDTLTLTISGTTNELVVSPSTPQNLQANRTWTLSFPSVVSLQGKGLLLPSSTTLPPTCSLGQIYFDTDATAGQNLYGCTATNVWTLEAGGGAGGGVPTSLTLTATAPLTGGGDLSANRSFGCPTCITSPAALTGALPLISSGGQAITTGTKSGTTSTKFVTMDASTPNPNDCVKWDANGNVTTAGAACGTGGVPATRTIGTTAPLAGGGTLAADLSLTCPTCTTANAGALTAGFPVVAQGTQNLGVGQRTGNTTTFVTRDTSSPQANECAKWDANGNLTTAGAACGTSTGASSDAHYLTTQSEPSLTNEANLALLGSVGSAGLLKITIGSGPVATPVLAQAGTDYVLPGGSITGNAATASAFDHDPAPCGANLFVTDIAAAGTLTCTQPAFSNLSGTAAVAQIPNLNTLNSGLTASQCVATDATGKLVSTGANCAVPFTTSATLAGIVTDETGFSAGALLVFNQSPTLVTPIIASNGFTNAQHNHQTAAGGGQLTDAALSTPVGVAKGGTNVTTSPDDNLLVGNGTTWQLKAIAPCLDTGGQHLNYDPGTNTFLCGTTVGGTGDITDVGTCASGACFTDTVPGARLTFSPSTAPGVVTGAYSLYVDTTSANIAVKDTAGVVKHGVQTAVPVTSPVNQFVTGINDAGAVSKQAVTKADVGLDQVDNTSDATKFSTPAVLTSKLLVPRTNPCSAVGTAPPTVTPNLDTTDICEVFNVGANTPVQIANPQFTGAVPYNNQRLEFIFKGTAPVALQWGNMYSAECGLPLPNGITGDGTGATSTRNHYLFGYNTSGGSNKFCLLATTRSPGRGVTELSVSTTSPTLLSTGANACNADTNDQCNYALTGAAGTVFLDVPVGTPTNGQQLVVGLRCTAFAQAISYNAIFIPSRDVPLPASCPVTAQPWIFLGFQYATAFTKWQLLGSTEAVTGSGGGSSLTIQEIDGSPTGVFTTLKVTNGSLTDNGGGVATLQTGAGGGGDVSSNTTTSVDSEVALFSGTAGKTIKRATGTGLAKLTSGVLSTGQASLTADVTGTLPVANGGTGVSATLSGLILGNGASAMSNYAGTSCTAQFPRSLSAAGVATCAKVDLTADVTGLLPAANGGNGNGFFAVSGPASTVKTYTLPNVSTTILTTNAAVTVPQGGTGLTAGTAGGVTYFPTTTTMASSGALTANALVVGGGASGPSTPVGLGTTTTVLHGNVSGNPSFSAVSLTADVSGTLPVGSGGTGLTVGTAGGIPYFSTTTALASTPALTANALVVGGGATGPTTPVGLGTSTTVLHGNAGGAPTFGSVSLTSGTGDVTGRLAYSNFVQATAASTVIGRSSASAGDWQEITLTSGDLAMSGTALGVGSNVCKINAQNLWGDGVRQTFNPSGVAAGVNVGGVGGDPSTPVNGDLWYDSTNNLLRAYINGAPVSLGAGGTGTACTPTGSDKQTQFNNAGALGASSGLTLSTSQVLTLNERITTMTTVDITPLTTADGPVIACTPGASNRVATLPTAATTSQGIFRLVKMDTAAGTCAFARGGSDTMNNQTSNLSVANRDEYLEARVVSSTNWIVTTKKLSVNLATDVSGRLAYSNLPDPGGTSRLMGRGDTTGDYQVITLGTGLTITGTQLAATNTSTPLASRTETTTGTDTTKAVTPDGLAHSDFGKRYITVMCIDDATTLTTGNGKCFIPLYKEFNGWNFVGASAYLGGATATGLTTIDIQRCASVVSGIRCSGTNVSVFSTTMTIDSGENSTDNAATAAVINSSNQGLSTGQWLRIDIGGTISGTPQGLYVTVVLQKP